MTKELEKLYYLLTEAITNADGTNKPKNEHVSICYTDLQTHITEQEKKDELLGLYRYVWNMPILSQTISFEEAINLIDKLEEELK